MNTHEFIVANVRKFLESQGVPAATAIRAAEDALEHYKRTAHFKRNAIDDCIKFAKKRVKDMAA